MARIGKGLWLWSILLWAVAVHAKPVQVTSSVDRNEMGVGDTFTYSIEVSSDDSVNATEPKLPPLNGFELINTWQGVESRSSFTNGTFEVVQSRTFNYMLAVNKAGTFTLGPATVIVDGKSYATQAIRIKVLEGRAAPPQAQNPPDEELEDMDDIFNQLLRRRFGNNPRGTPVNPEDAFFIQVEVDKEKAYVGEQVTASWYLYSRGQIHDIDTLKYPSLTGFWKEEIELATRLNFQQAILNGIVYQKALLASYALFPIKAGAVKVDPYRAKCTVTVPAAFGFSRPYQFTKASRELIVQTSDVPTDQRPANFTGAVGRFQARASLAQTTVVANQPLSLKVKFEGRGNAKLIDLPRINLPSGIEIYDTKSESKFFKEGTSYKEFELVLVPRQAGQITLPPFEISAFDPATAKFYVVATEAIVLNVLPGSGPQPVTGAAPTAKSEVETEAKGPALPALSQEMESSHWSLPLPKSWLWAVIYGLVLAVLAWRLMSEGDFFRRRKDLKRLLSARMNRIHGLIQRGAWREVGAQGTNLIYFMMGEISGSRGASLEFSKLMAEAPPSVRHELAEPVQQLLQKLELLSFAPEKLVGAAKDKPQLKELVHQMDAVLRRALNLVEEARNPMDREESTL